LSIPLIISTTFQIGWDLLSDSKFEEFRRIKVAEGRFDGYEHEVAIRTVK